MKLKHLFDWHDMPGPGDEATWGPPTGHPNDPRTPEYHAQTFEDHVVVDTVYYDQNSQEHPIKIKVEVEAEADDNGRHMTWAIGRFTPIAVKLGEKTVPWEQFIRAIPETDNEMFFDTQKYMGEWHDVLNDAMDRPDDPHAGGDDYYEDRDR